MRLSIITPSILRSTLVRLCESIDQQTNQDFEHIIMVDMPHKEAWDNPKTRNVLSHASLTHPNRTLYWCDKRHCNCGNTCRHNAYAQAKGDYIFCIDDDDYFADRDVFRSLEAVEEDWAIFPVMMGGRILFSDPPQACHIGTGNFMHRRGIARWPDVQQYETDWIIINEQLLGKYKYQVLHCRPLVIHSFNSVGVYF